MPPNNTPLRKAKMYEPESGNVFLFILIGIVLFAALSFTISRGFHTESTSTLTERELALAAADVLSFAQKVERGYNRLLQKGCSESQISSSGSHPKGTFNNANAPADNSCHLFDPNGAGLEYEYPPDGFQSLATSDWYANWWFIKFRGKDIGQDDCTDQYLVLRALTPESCEALNTAAGHSFASIPVNALPIGAGDYFLGQASFTCTAGTIQFNIAELQDQTAFCYDDGSATTSIHGKYRFMYLLHER